MLASEPKLKKQAGLIVQRVVLVLVLIAVGLGVYNVTVDMTPVIKSARLALACPSEAECRLSRWERRPWEQRLEFYLGSQGKVVLCRPQYWLVGTLQCAVSMETAAPPQVTR